MGYIAILVEMCAPCYLTRLLDPVLALPSVSFLKLVNFDQFSAPVMQFQPIVGAPLTFGLGSVSKACAYS